MAKSRTNADYDGMPLDEYERLCLELLQRKRIIDPDCELNTRDKGELAAARATIAEWEGVQLTGAGGRPLGSMRELWILDTQTAIRRLDGNLS
jgi:hypothetical protein